MTRMPNPVSHESLVAARVAAGLSQREVADGINVSDRTIWALENGGDPKVSLLNAVAGLYGVPIETFLLTTKPAAPNASQAKGEQRAQFEENPSNGDRQLH